jgi:16S rRNA (adenine1518-N6/adenine1519-N6)-dimethyltransferase
MGRGATRDTLRRHGLHLRRGLGQNFLVEDGIAERLAQTSGAGPGDAVLEVGTGLGVLTRALAARADRVITVEIDSGLVAALQSDAALPANVELIHADALDLDLEEVIARLAVAGRRVRLVSNLPYSAASPLLRRLLDLRDRLEDWSVMLQREMANRLLAEAGSRAYGSLTVLHRLTVDVTREVDLKPGCFFPPPKVSSTFVRMFPRADCPLRAGELPKVERVVRAVFNQRRKTIFNGLRGGGLPLSTDREALEAALEQAGIPPGERAENVAPEGLLALSRALEPEAPD